MSGQYLFNIMGKNNQANPMTMKNDLGFVSSLYGTGISRNSENDLLQNANRIKGIVKTFNNLNYESILLSADSSFTITNNALLKTTNTNKVNGKDVILTINRKLPIHIKAKTTKIVVYENNNIIEIK